MTGKHRLIHKFNAKKAQVTLELTLGIIVALIFLMGATAIFVWLNSSLAERQEAYERTRLGAGKYDLTQEELTVYQPKILNIKLFGSNE